MKAFNYPVTSREYKLMLNTDRFKDLEHGSKVFMNLIELLVHKEGGTVELTDKEEKRATSYLDTPELALRQLGYSLRLRKDAKSFQINLKYRSSDRYLAANQDLSSSHPDKKAVSHKFEEDILPPFVSKFSHSASIKFDKHPDIKTVQQLVALFPGLEKLPLDADDAIRTINNFEAHEVVRKLCKFRFDDSIDLKACLSFWYLQENTEDWPLVGEFSFDYDQPEDAIKNGELESYPSAVVTGANRFFVALQSQTGWINFNTTTKTAFALEVL